MFEQIDQIIKAAKNFFEFICSLINILNVATWLGRKKEPNINIKDTDTPAQATLKRGWRVACKVSLAVMNLVIAILFAVTAIVVLAAAIPVMVVCWVIALISSTEAPPVLA